MAHTTVAVFVAGRLEYDICCFTVTCIICHNVYTRYKLDKDIEYRKRSTQRRRGDREPEELRLRLLPSLLSYVFVDIDYSYIVLTDIVYCILYIVYCIYCIN